MSTCLAELAELVGGEVRGDPTRTVSAVKTLDTAGPGDLSFLTSVKYRDAARSSAAGALLVGRDLGTDDLPAGDLLICTDPYHALAQILGYLHPRPVRPAGIHPTAVIEDGAEVSPTAHVGPLVVVGSGSRIEEGVVLHPHVVVGRRCRIGHESVLFSHVSIYDETEIGARVIIHSGTVIGADGFGFADHAGSRVKLPHVGRVVLEDDVEIGANSAVDRATLDETRIGAGSKLDNLVQVGHNVRIGRGAILCGQAGVSGSALLGDRVILAGQSGVAGHLELGDGASLAGKSAAFKSVPAGQMVAGVPAVPAARWRRQVAGLAHLEELRRRLNKMEKELAALRVGSDEEG